MTDLTQIPPADTSDMIGLHQVFRDALNAAPRLVGTVADGDIARADVVSGYYSNVLNLLHVHHESEDALVTPKLLERCPERATTIERVAGQHNIVLGALEWSEKCLAPWHADATATARQDLVGALATLNTVLTTHLNDEEREILPIAAAHLNAMEWGEIPGHAMQAFTGDKLWLVLGLVQEQMAPEQRTEMEAHMPPPLAEFWTQTGRGLFQAYVTELRS